MGEIRDDAGYMVLASEVSDLACTTTVVFEGCDGIMRVGRYRRVAGTAVRVRVFGAGRATSALPAAAAVAGGAAGAVAGGAMGAGARGAAGAVARGATGTKGAGTGAGAVTPLADMGISPGSSASST